MPAIIGFDAETRIDASDFAGKWNTELPDERVAEVRRPSSTFDADWVTYLGAVAAAVQLGEWVGLPKLREIIKTLYPQRAQDADKLLIEEHRVNDKTYVRVRNPDK